MGMVSLPGNDLKFSSPLVAACNHNAAGANRARPCPSSSTMLKMHVLKKRSGQSSHGIFYSRRSDDDAGIEDVLVDAAGLLQQQLSRC